MNLFALVLILSLTIASALASAHNPILTARQAHPHRSRGLSLSPIDVCATLDVDLDVLHTLTGEDLSATGHIKVCICLSLVPAFIQANLVAQAAVRRLGEASVTAAITTMINAAPSKQTCAYPPHARSLCTPDDPCAFQCIDGYSNTADSGPSACICAAPNTECNGQCGYFPQGCASAAAAPPHRRSLGPAPMCDFEGGEVCGVIGRRKSWECVNTGYDLESCGGCTTPSPFGSTARVARTHGVDCSTIPHVRDVSCTKGKCLVVKCADGHVPSPTGELCVAVGVDWYDGFSLALGAHVDVRSADDGLGTTVRGEDRVSVAVGVRGVGGRVARALGLGETVVEGQLAGAVEGVVGATIPVDVSAYA